MTRGYCGQCGGPYSDEVPCDCQRRAGMSESEPSDDLDRWRLHVAEVTGNQMSNAHIELINRWPSAYALSRATGVPYTTAKRWRRRQCIADPAYWLPLISAAGMEPTKMCYELARDYGVK